MDINQNPSPKEGQTMTTTDRKRAAERLVAGIQAELSTKICPVCGKPAHDVPAR